MNALQDKIRELDAEREQLKNENLLLRQTLTVIRTYLNNAKPEIKTFEIIHDLKHILINFKIKDSEVQHKPLFPKNSIEERLIDKAIKQIFHDLNEEK